MRSTTDRTTTTRGRGYRLWWAGVSAACVALVAVGWSLGMMAGEHTNQETNQGVGSAELSAVTPTDAPG